jgi:hypothetical protein
MSSLFEYGAACLPPSLTHVQSGKEKAHGNEKFFLLRFFF